MMKSFFMSYVMSGTTILDGELDMEVRGSGRFDARCANSGLPIGWGTYLGNPVSCILGHVITKKISKTRVFSEIDRSSPGAMGLMSSFGPASNNEIAPRGITKCIDTVDNRGRYPLQAGTARVVLIATVSRARY